LSGQIAYEIKEELHRILEFWRRLKDDRSGGFYCSVDFNLRVDREADKSGVAAARNLWTFSRAYHLTNEIDYRKLADHAYAFFVRHLVDNLHGGIYWLVDYEGAVIDSRKHIYLQAFGVYALSEYYLATGTRRAIELAMKIWHLIEEKGWNPESGCYREEFSREWEETDNELLSENEIVADITANTHLHILESYTTFYKAFPTKPLRESLIRVLDIFAERIYSPAGRYQKIFLDSHWNEIIDLKSYGHDIEASWLINDTLRVLSLNDDKYDKIVISLAEQVLITAVQPDGSLINEVEGGEVDENRLWWVQAEAAVGFFNAWEKTEDEKYYKAFADIWSYIREKIVDHRSGGEWLYGRNSEGDPLKSDVVEHWKTPYHNSRCCMELFSRLTR